MSRLDRFRRRATPSVQAPTFAQPSLSVVPPTVARDQRPAAEWPIAELDFCVVDVETTGLNPGRDRVVEIAVIRCDAHGQVLDEWHTLVHPQRPVDGGWIHGIDDDMVAGAPTFGRVAPRLLASLSGAVLVAHNAAFDRRFVEAELASAGVEVRLPYLCTMHMRRHVGRGAPVMHRLSWACWQSGTPLDEAHAAVSDARAVAALLRGYLGDAREAGHETLRPLAATAAAAEACGHPILAFASMDHAARLTPRTVIDQPRPVPVSPVTADALDAYRDALAEAVHDFELDGAEVDELRDLVAELGMSATEIQNAHRDFTRERLAEYLDDDELAWEEYEQLRILSRLLAIDGAWLADLVADVRPHHVAATVPPLDDAALSADDVVLDDPIAVCFTGPFEAMPLTRDEVQALATDAGMDVRSGVSAKLDVLVCRDPYAGTSKLRRAESHGTVVVDQETFLAIAGVATPTPSPTAAVLNAIAARRRVVRTERAKTANPQTSPRSEPTPRRVTVAVSDVPAEQTLWCQAGAHQWSRPAQRGRPPKRCPEH